MSIATQTTPVPVMAASYQPRPIAGSFAGRHIVSVEQFARADLDELFRSAAGRDAGEGRWSGGDVGHR